MGALPAELWEQVDGELVVGTTFAEFVENTRCFGEERGEILLAWLGKQPVEEDLVPFDGTVEELDVVRGHVQGMPCVVASKVA
jgi:hypothetical protein